MTIKGKDLIERIKDTEYSEDLIKELEKYEVKKPKSVWGLKDGDKIWNVGFDSVNSKCVSWSTQWFGVGNDHYIRELGRVHLTKERAELHARVLNTELAIKKWKRENDNVELDWGDGDRHKYLLACDYQDEEIRIDGWYAFKFANTIYFSSELKAQQCINDIGEERIIEWIKWEDNGQ